MFLEFPSAKHPERTRESKSSTQKYAITLTYFKQHVEDAEIQTGELIIIEIPIYPFLLKYQKINIHGYEIVATKMKREIIPQDYHRRLFALFPSETQRSRATLPQYWPRHQRVRASRDYWLRWPSSARV